MGRQLTLRTAFRSHGREARQALRETLSRLKSGDPLRHVTVAVPSNLAGLSLRRSLGRGGLVNVSFITLPRVIELIGAPRLAAEQRRPLSAAYRSEAIRAVLADDPGPFAEIRLDGGLRRSVETLFGEFDDLDPAALGAVADLGPRQRYLVGRYRAYRNSIAADWYDDRDLAQAALTSLRDDPARTVELAGAFALYLPSEISDPQRAVVDGLAEQTESEAIIGLSGDADVDAASYRDWGVDLPAPPLSDPPLARHLVQTPDAEEEVRETARRIAELLHQGVPLYRCALLWPRAEPYARIAAEQLDAAGLPWNGAASRSLAETMPARTLIGLLRLADRRFERRAVADWLNSAPILESPDGRPVPSRRWESVSRAADIVHSADQWRDRLPRYARKRRQRLDDLRRGDGLSDFVRAMMEREIEQIDRLAAFVDELIGQIESAPASEAETAPWSAWTDWARQSLERYLGEETRVRNIAALAGSASEIDAPTDRDDGDAYAEVLRQLDILDALDPLGGATASRFASTLERALDRPFGRIRRFGDGVYTGSLRSAWGLEFDHVWIVGASEGALPVRRHEGPLISDDQRRAAGLDGRAEHDRRERANYLAALAAAPGNDGRTLLYPRADLRGQRGRQPSRWLLESAAATAGRRIFASDLESSPDNLGWLDLLPSFESALESSHARAPQRLAPAEDDLARLLAYRRAGRRLESHHLAAAERGLRDGFALQRARRGWRFDEWTGALPGPGQRSPLQGRRALSATALQNWAECPFRFLLANLLRVAETDEPEDELVISPLERGSLVHEVLDAFIRQMPPRRSPNHEWSESERTQLRRLGEEACDRAQAAGLAGRPLLWAHARAEILRDLDAFPDRDQEHRRKYGVVQSHSELAFGLTDPDAASADPLEIDVAGGRLRLRGRIDRIDRSADGSRLVVTDYKTGRPSKDAEQLDDDPVRGGRLLQLPIYALAAERHLLSQGEPPSRVIDVAYWYLTEKGGNTQLGYRFDAPERERFEEALSRIAVGIEGGVFPANPGVDSFSRGKSGPRHCGFCPYDRICPTNRQSAWEHLQQAAVHPGLTDYIDLYRDDDDN